jgi:hypothetical protein
MCTLQRLESSNSDPKSGGCLLVFTPTLSKVIAWQNGAPIDAFAAAKQFTASVIDDLQKLASEEGDAAIRDTNWPSVAAGLQTVIREWNDRLRDALYAQGEIAARVLQ